MNDKKLILKNRRIFIRRVAFSYNLLRKKVREVYFVMTAGVKLSRKEVKQKTSKSMKLKGLKSSIRENVLRLKVED
ncbi:MAG: hypothetical protein COS36_03910 [Candidatus Altarchaeum sp. CG03_land_8_20_14_0_80_32_618]|nr:MAG: hypothetical protein AUK59_02465 [Candidatus Altarchaeum sp. CG2_30_32_3053]PIV27947.1 MAG: hypothetical protein COS36_03910 [Candidatus Altarchaeum sp. CG03_land_8_20_14_0_80_32_618]